LLEASAELAVVKIAAVKALTLTYHVQGRDPFCPPQYTANMHFLPPSLQPEFIDIIKAAEVKTK
jgi:hypothetical protein